MSATESASTKTPRLVEAATEVGGDRSPPAKRKAHKQNDADPILVGATLLEKEAAAVLVIAQQLTKPTELREAYKAAIQLLVKRTGYMQVKDKKNQSGVRTVHRPGRVIVSGMGKSGHVGAKAAATFASTGTPASFVHPGEASHGDLGMISKRDVVLAISNSGSTAELLTVVQYAQKHDIPLIGITSSPDSPLGQAADIKLILPNIPEACPLGRAPTTSTTMTLALCDALAVSAMKQRGFTDKDFGNYHPGGNLGQLIKKSTLG